MSVIRGFVSKAGLGEASKGLGTEEIRPRMASNVAPEASDVSVLFVSKAGLGEASKGLGTEEIRPRMASNVGFECVYYKGIHVKHRPRRGLERLPNRGNPAWTALDGLVCRLRTNVSLKRGFV